MPHFRVEDSLDSHPKAQRAGDEALGMWLRAGSWSMRYLTDGFIPDWWVRQQPRGTAKAKRLVEAGFWHPSEKDGEKGWQFHEFVGPGRQDSAERIRADREKWRKKKAEQRDSPRDSPPVSPGDTSGESPEESRVLPQHQHQQNSGHPESASPDSTGREPRSAPVRSDAHRLVGEIIPDNHPPAVQTELRLQASALLNAGQPTELVADALRLWTTKSVHPKTLPALVSELINQRNKPTATSTNGKPHKMRSLAELAQTARAAEHAQLADTARKELA